MNWECAIAGAAGGATALFLGLIAAAVIDALRGAGGADDDLSPQARPPEALPPGRKPGTGGADRTMWG